MYHWLRVRKWLRELELWSWETCLRLRLLGKSGRRLPREHRCGPEPWMGLSSTFLPHTPASTLPSAFCPGEGLVINNIPIPNWAESNCFREIFFTGFQAGHQSGRGCAPRGLPPDLQHRKVSFQGQQPSSLYTFRICQLSLLKLSPLASACSHCAL